MSPKRWIRSRRARAARRFAGDVAARATGNLVAGAVRWLAGLAADRLA